MISAILDTNVVLQSVISTGASASIMVLERYFDGDFETVFSDETIDELINVLSLARMRTRHGFSDDRILEYVDSLLDNGRTYAVNQHVSPQLTHDITDTKFLELALESSANYLVTNDSRHLLPIGRFAKTQIVRPAEFLSILAEH